MAKVLIAGQRKWTSRIETPIQFAGFDAEGNGTILTDYLSKDVVNYDTHKGYAEFAHGYRVRHRLATAVASKAGGSWTHIDADGDEYPVFYSNTILYGLDTDTTTMISMQTGLTERFAPFFANSPVSGISAWVNGTNTQAQAIRVISGEVSAAVYNMDPTDGPAVTNQNLGGTLAEQAYEVRVTFEDQDGAINMESGPATSQTVTLGVGDDTIRVDISGMTIPTRATHWNAYVSTTTDTATAFLKEIDSTVIATTSVDISSLVSGAAIASQNGVYRTMDLPLAGVDMAVMYGGRMFVAALDSHLVYWSERDNINYWFSSSSTTNLEGQWAGTVTGLAAGEDGVYIFTSDSIFRIRGNFVFDTDSGTPNITTPPEVVATALGTGSPGSVFTMDQQGVFFISGEGIPHRIVGGRPFALAPLDFKDESRCLDFTYNKRWVGAPDIEKGYACWCMTRKVNATRPQDGAAVAGICDRIYRYDTNNNAYTAPLEMEVVHLVSRPSHTAPGTQTSRPLFMASGPNGTVNELNFGRAHGPGGDLITSADVSGTNYDGLQATAETTTSAGMVLAGITDNDLVGYGAVLHYHVDDTNYGDEDVYVTISANTTAAGTLTINWLGAKTVSTGTKWTVRLAAPRKTPGYIGPLNPSPKVHTNPHRIQMSLIDTIGAEAV